MLTAKEIFIECYRRVFSFLPDKLLTQSLFYLKMGKKLNLKDPKTFNEKLQWLKLYDRNPLYTTLVDKYAVKKYIADTIGEEYVIPTLGVWKRFEDINFDKLPDRFILKATHDSGTYKVCRDKKTFDYETARALFRKKLRQDYYVYTREFPYKAVKKQIIAEELLQTADNTLPVDYKFFCFDGKADCVMVCVGRGTGKTRFYFFDKDWNLLRLNPAGIAAAEDFTLPKPAKINEMFDLAEKLSQGIPFVRIDLYCENDKIYFGEFTFYPSAGFDKNLLPETDLLLGSKINLRSSR